MNTMCYVPVVSCCVSIVPVAQEDNVLRPRCLFEGGAAFQHHSDRRWRSFLRPLRGLLRLPAQLPANCNPHAGGGRLGIAPLEDRMQAVEEILSIPDTMRAFAIFPFGYPAEERKQQDRFDETRIHYVE